MGSQIMALQCFVSLGMFRDERAVRVELPDGRELSMLVDKRAVLVDREPTAGEEEVPGRVLVVLIEEQDGSALIDLPRPTLTEGPRLNVPRSALVQAAA